MWVQLVCGTNEIVFSIAELRAIVDGAYWGR